MFLKREVVSTLDEDKFVYEQNHSSYLNDIHEHKKGLRNSINYGRLSDEGGLQFNTHKSVARKR